MQFGKINIVKNLDHGDSARDKLVEGINKLADAVGSTLGASGRTVVIEDDFGNPQVTKDGVTVAKYIVLDDPIENLGAAMLKQAAQNTAAKAGDGTTTSTVLAQALIKECLQLTVGYRDIKSGVAKGLDKALKDLTSKAKPVTKKSLLSVSTIAANNDPFLGGLIAKAFEKAEPNGFVTVEKNTSSETEIASIEGTHIGGTSKMPHFYTNKEKEVCQLDKPLVFLSVTEIKDVRKIQAILEYAIKHNRALLIIAPLDTQPLSALAMNNVKGNIKVNVIDPPSFGQKRLDILEDIGALTGATPIDESLGDALDMITRDCLGEAAAATTNIEGTTLTFLEKTIEVEKRITDLQKILDMEDHHAYSEHLETRLAILSGGVTTIKVGADTDVELKEKLDRVDDAVQAVKAAKLEGVLPGGGAALHCIATDVNHKELTKEEHEGYKAFQKTLKAPFNKILDNANVTTKRSKFLWGEGVDVIDGNVKDLVRNGIIDPALVTKEALKNAVSVALTILSTDTVISNVREK